MQPKNDENLEDRYDLYVKRVAVELVLALELLAVRLVHGQLVLPALEHLDLIGHLQPAPGEASLSGDGHRGLGALLQLDHLLHVRVVVDDVGQPNLGDLLVSEGVQGGLELEVVEQSPDLWPFQDNPKLKLDLMVDLFNLNNLHEDDRYPNRHGNDVSLLISGDGRDLDIVAAL